MYRETLQTPKSNRFRWFRGASPGSQRCGELARKSHYTSRSITVRERSRSSRFPQRLAFRKHRRRASLEATRPVLSSRLHEFAPKVGQDVQPELLPCFVRLSGWLRPNSRRNARAKLTFLPAPFAVRPEWKGILTRAFNALTRSADVEQLLAHRGVPRDVHIWGAAVECFASSVRETTDAGSERSPFRGLHDAVLSLEATGAVVTLLEQRKELA